MYYRDENGEWQEIILEPSGDTLPIGSEVDFDGDTVPTGWQVVNNNIVSNGSPIKLSYKEDGKDVYVQKIKINSLPNATSIDYPVSLPNDIKITKMESTMYFANGDTTSLPYSYGDSGTTNVSTPAYRKNDNAIRIAAGTDRSSASAEIKIYFTYND